MVFDLVWFYFFNNLVGKSLISDLVFLFLAQSLPYLMVLVFIVWGYASHKSWRERLILWSTGAAAALAARFVVGSGLRLFYHRPRPFLAHQVQKLITESSWSFPSGHALFFFALAIVVYLNNRKWGWVFFITSLIMGLARVAAGVHYPTDILGGIILGIGTGIGVYYLMNFLNKKFGGKVFKFLK